MFVGWAEYFLLCLRTPCVYPFLIGESPTPARHQDSIFCLLLMRSVLVFRFIPGTLAKGLTGAYFGEKDQMALKNKAVE